MPLICVRGNLGKRAMDWFQNGHNHFQPKGEELSPVSACVEERKLLTWVASVLTVPAAGKAFAHFYFGVWLSLRFEVNALLLKAVSEGQYLSGKQRGSTDPSGLCALLHQMAVAVLSDQLRINPMEIGVRGIHPRELGAPYRSASQTQENQSLCALLMTALGYADEINENWKRLTDKSRRRMERTVCMLPESNSYPGLLFGVFYRPQENGRGIRPETFWTQVQEYQFLSRTFWLGYEIVQADEYGIVRLAPEENLF